MKADRESRGRKRAGPPPLRAAILALRKLYGRPKPPAVTDPFGQILWENVAYLASDDRRAEAFALLEESVGLDPRKILRASAPVLREIGRRGILPSNTAGKLRESARIAVEQFGGDLRPIRRLPLPKAIGALKRFPSIGDPAAERILLFARAHPVLGLDSNGLRVLLRLGFGKAGKSYSATYRSAQEAAISALPRKFDALIEAHQLLRQHGQELCKRSHPLCEACPLRRGCAYASAQAARAAKAARPRPHVRRSGPSLR